MQMNKGTAVKIQKLMVHSKAVDDEIWVHAIQELEQFYQKRNMRTLNKLTGKTL